MKNVFVIAGVAFALAACTPCNQMASFEEAQQCQANRIALLEAFAGAAASYNTYDNRVSTPYGTYDYHATCWGANCRTTVTKTR